MPKFTLICENDSAVIGASSKTIVEGHPITIQNAVELFERFLRGSGFEFSGELSLKNITEPTNNDSDDYISLGDITLDIDNYGAAQPFYGYDEYSGLSFSTGVDTITLTGHNPEMSYPEIKVELEEEKPKKKKKK